jgi:hypothetical protein
MCAKAYQTDTIPHRHVDTCRVYLHAIAASHTQYTPSVNNVKDDTTTKRQQHTNNPPTQTSSGKTSTTPHRRTTRMMTSPVVPHTPPEHTRHADQSHKISVTNMYTHTHVK